MTALSILPAATGYSLRISEPWGLNVLSAELVSVAYGSFSTRPDPIRRAWVTVEARRGWPADRPSLRQATRNGVGAPIATPAPPAPPKNNENVFQRVRNLLRGGR